jgi:hypothetical protein
MGLPDNITLKCCKCAAEITHDGTHPSLTRFDSPNMYKGVSRTFNNLTHFIHAGWRGDGLNVYCPKHAKEYNNGAVHNVSGH